MTGRGKRVSLGMLLAVNVAVWSLVIAGGASAHRTAPPDRGARATHPVLSGAAAPDVAPAATAFGAASSAVLVHNFNGVSSLDSAVTSGITPRPVERGRETELRDGFRNRPNGTVSAASRTGLVTLRSGFRLFVHF